MKLSTPQSLKQIASLIKAKYTGRDNFSITGINEIHKVEHGDLTFVDHPKYYDKALQSAATTILINKEVKCPDGKALIFSDDPFRDYNFLTLHFKPLHFSSKNISDSARIGNGTVLMPGVYIGNNVIIGNHCIIHPNVVLYDDVIVGNHVEIHANTVIGSHAFYYKKRPEGFDKMHSCGRVLINDNVEIGACCTIDKGVSGDTIIDEGTKIDNHVHIGHDTVVGKNCLFAAQVGIAGVTTIEDNVTLWGQVGIRSDVTLGKGATVLAQSGVGENIAAGKTYFGSPAGDAREKMKELVYIKRLPEIFKK